MQQCVPNVMRFNFPYPRKSTCPFASAHTTVLSLETDTSPIWRESHGLLRMQRFPQSSSR